MPDDKRPTTTFYVEWLKHIKIYLQAYNGWHAYEKFEAYKNYTKKWNKKDASVTRFLHSCNLRLFRGLEHSNVKLMLNIDMANRVVNDYKRELEKKMQRKWCTVWFCEGLTNFYQDRLKNYHWTVQKLRKY